MKPTDVLRDEHEVITSALAALDALAEEVATDGAVTADTIVCLLDFFTEFADGCHHRKEEELLFPALCEAGLPRDGGPIPCMLHDHHQGRALLWGMRAAVAELPDRGARDRFVAAARSYHELLASHIVKENQMLFRLADLLLSREAEARLREAFAAADEKTPARAAVEELARRVVSAQRRAGADRSGRGRRA